MTVTGLNYFIKTRKIAQQYHLASLRGACIAVDASMWSVACCSLTFRSLSDPLTVRAHRSHGARPQDPRCTVSVRGLRRCPQARNEVRRGDRTPCSMSNRAITVCYSSVTSQLMRKINELRDRWGIHPHLVFDGRAPVQKERRRTARHGSIHPSDIERVKWVSVPHHSPSALWSLVPLHPPTHPPTPSPGTTSCTCCLLPQCRGSRPRHCPYGQDRLCLLSMVE